MDYFLSPRHLRGLEREKPSKNDQTFFLNADGGHGDITATFQILLGHVMAQVISCLKTIYFIHYIVNPITTKL
jgi:hypothetical protein